MPSFSYLSWIKLFSKLRQLVGGVFTPTGSRILGCQAVPDVCMYEIFITMRSKVKNVTYIGLGIRMTKICTFTSWLGICAENP